VILFNFSNKFKLTEHGMLSHRKAVSRCTPFTYIMSRSIHITKRNFNGLSKKEIDEQAFDPQSELNQWVKKSTIKKVIKKSRKEKGSNR
jgi:hypothetical protein